MIVSFNGLDSIQFDVIKLNSDIPCYQTVVNDWNMKVPNHNGGAKFDVGHFNNEITLTTNAS